MPGSIISLHVGQCGNQIGTEFWKTMCEEHGIGNDGALVQPNQQGMDRKEMFFNELNMGTRFMPRSVLVDLEPRVINQIKMSEYGQLHNHSNMYTSPSGGGAGNNWASGYNQSEETMEAIFDIISREAENAESLEGFVLCHSISGGTGSGLGSKILEEIRSRYSKTILQTCSVFSSIKDSSDVVVGPYNSLLTLDWLVEQPDFVVVLDNRALYRVAIDTLRIQPPTLEHINSMVSRLLTSVTAPMRFCSPVYTRLSHVAACMNPFPNMQFIQTAYAPFIPIDNKYVVNTSAERVLSRIMEPKSLISSAAETVALSKSPSDLASSRNIEHCMLSALAIVQVDSRIPGNDLTPAAIRRQTHKNNIRYPPWSSTALSIVSCNLSPYMEHNYQASGLMLANHTNISGVLRQVVEQYDQLHKRKAFIDRFEREDKNIMETMNESREKLVSLVKLYEEATTMDFMADAMAGYGEMDNSSTFNSTLGNDNSETQI